MYNIHHNTQYNLNQQLPITATIMKPLWKIFPVFFGQNCTYDHIWWSLSTKAAKLKFDTLNDHTTLIQFWTKIWYSMKANPDLNQNL